jgi:hypothetical protein
VILEYDTHNKTFLEELRKGMRKLFALTGETKILQCITGILITNRYSC